MSGKVSVLQTCLVFAVCFSALALNEQGFFFFFVTCPFHSCFTVNLLKILYNLKLYQIVYFKIVGHFELQSTETLFRCFGSVDLIFQRWNVYFLFIKHYENTHLFICYHSNHPNSVSTSGVRLEAGYWFFWAEKVSVLETCLIFCRLL